MPPKKLPKWRRENNNSADPLWYIKELGRKALQEGDGVCFSVSEVNKATSITRAWATKADNDDGESPGVWVAIGEDAQPYLHALYAIALRRSSVLLTPSLGDSLREAYIALRAKLSFEIFNTMYDEGTHAPPGAVRALLFKALRAHILRCIAALLADASAQLQGKNARYSYRNLQAALDVLEEANKLIELCQDDLTAGAKKAAKIPNHKFVEILGRELIASRLLEHWARLLLLLSACQGWADKARKQLHQLANTLSMLGPHFSSSWHHRLILDSPCLSYLMSSHVTALCAELDGGPTYGLPTHSSAADDEPPAAPVHVAPTYGSTGLRLVRNAPEGACAALAQWALCVWAETIAHHHGPTARLSATAAAATAPSRPPLTATPPLNTRATFELSMRLATLAMISMATSVADTESLAAGGGTGGKTADGATPASTPPHTSGGRSRDRSGREPPRVLQIAPAQAPALAMYALVCGRAALGPTVLTARELPPKVLSRLDLWWRSMCNFLRLAVPAPGCNTRFKAADGKALELEWDFLDLQFVVPLQPLPGHEGIPATPSPCVRAALSAGFLTQFNRLVRWLNAQDDECVWFNCLSWRDNMRWAWSQLMAFASPADTSALVLSLCESLETNFNRMVASTGTDMSISERESPRTFDSICNVYQQTVRALCKWSRELHGKGVGGISEVVQAADADEASGPVQLSRAVSFMAVNMVPRVVGILLDAVRPSGAVTEVFRRHYAQGMLRRMRAVLEFMTLMAAAHFFSAVKLTTTSAAYITSCMSGGEAGPSSTGGMGSGAGGAANKKPRAVTIPKGPIPRGLGCGLESRDSRAQEASGSSATPEQQQQQDQQQQTPSDPQQQQEQQPDPKMHLLAVAAAGESSAAFDRSWTQHMVLNLRLNEVLGSVVGLVATSTYRIQERRDLATALRSLLRALLVTMPSELAHAVNSPAADVAAAKAFHRLNLAKDSALGARVEAAERDITAMALLDDVFNDQQLNPDQELMEVLWPLRVLAAKGVLVGRDLRSVPYVHDLMELAPAAGLMLSPRVLQQQQEAA